MRTLLRALVLPIVSIVLAGCGLRSGYTVTSKPKPTNSYNNLASFVHPAFVGRRFARIAVVADTSDVHWRYKFEREVVGKLRDAGGDAREGNTFFPPTRSWTQSEKIAAMIAGGVDAYLHVTIDSVKAGTRWIPETTSTTVSRERDVKDTVKSGPGRDTTRKETRHGAETWRETETTTKKGGYGAAYRSEYLRIALIEATTGCVAWLGFTTFSGYWSSDIESLAKVLADRLLYDEMLRKAGT